MTAVSFEEARACVIREFRGFPAATPLAIVTIPLEEADGRVLAETVYADRDYPPTARSMRDGFAVRSADLPGRLWVKGEVRAGETYQGEIGPGETIEIMTGAPLPHGADQVVMVEETTRDGDFVLIQNTPAKSGANFNPRGCEARLGDPVLSPKRLRFADIALLATLGHSNVNVYRQPRIAVLSTGDEVVDITMKPRADQVRNSNAWSLAAQIRRAGGEPVVLPVARDQYDHTRDLIQRGLREDLLLLSGGVSAGKYDIVEKVLADLGAEFFFTRVRIQPGQPLVFGTVQNKFFFGLPGNPASTMVTFEVFARAAVELLSGMPEVMLPFTEVTLAKPFQQKPGLTRFLPATLSPDGASMEPVAWKGSGDVMALSRANCFLVSDPSREHYAAGDRIRVLLT
jgi:molybdopterin molybdotransferase